MAARPHRCSLLLACVAVLAVAATTSFPSAQAPAAGPRASVAVPTGAAVIDGAGQFVVPGFIDTTVHLSLYGGVNDRYDTLVRCNPRQAEIVLEAAQVQLKHGVTTVRDSYGVLPALVDARELIALGQAVGARILAAGNIVGWGGPYSVSFSLIREAGLTRFQEQMNDPNAQGASEDSGGHDARRAARGHQCVSRQGVVTGPVTVTSQRVATSATRLPPPRLRRVTGGWNTARPCAEM